MNFNFEYILKYPIQIFKNKYVLRVAIYSCLILYFLLAISNIVYNVSPEFFDKHIYLYNIAKDSIYQVLSISSLGYFISKYRFCYWSLLSFYGIIYLKLIWFIDKYIYSFSNFLNLVDVSITIITLSMIIYYFYKNYKIKID